MVDVKIQTLHPFGKNGKRISREKYEVIKSAILSSLKNKELTRAELFDDLKKNLTGKFLGNIS